MARLEWSPKYLTGIDVIDSDHQGLFRAINDLHDRLIGKAQAKDVEDALNMLVDYVDAHFAREEALMQAANYPDVVEHTSSHRRISRQVHDYQTAYEENGGVIDVDSFLDFLGNWLKGHIAMTDTDYIPYVKKLDN